MAYLIQKPTKLVRFEARFTFNESIGLLTAEGLSDGFHDIVVTIDGEETHHRIESRSSLLEIQFEKSTPAVLYFVKLRTPGEIENQKAGFWY